MRTKLVIILIFIGISLYLWLPAFNTLNEFDDNDEPELIPDFTATLLHQEMFNDEGKLKQEVFSQKMEHYAQLALTYCEQPEFIIYQDDKPFWRLAAMTGSVQDGRLTMENDVTWFQLNDNKLVTSIETEYIEIDLDSQLVVTDKPIIIRGEKTTIEGKGLRADLKAERVTLTKHVRTILKGNQDD